MENEKEMSPELTMDDVFVVMAANMYAAPRAGQRTEPNVTTLLLRARSQEEADEVARMVAIQFALDHAPDMDANEDMSIEELQDRCEAVGFRVTRPAALRLSELPFYTATCPSCQS